MWKSWRGDWEGDKVWTVIKFRIDIITGNQFSSLKALSLSLSLFPSFSLFIYLFYFILFYFIYFETWFFCVALAVLELTR